MTAAADTSWRSIEALELADWLELPLVCEMRPPTVAGQEEACARPAVWRLVRWCGCSELSCEPCRADYLGFVSRVCSSEVPVGLFGCLKCGAEIRPRIVSDVVRKVVAL